MRTNLNFHQLFYCKEGLKIHILIIIVSCMVAINVSPKAKTVFFLFVWFRLFSSSFHCAIRGWQNVWMIKNIFIFMECRSITRIDNGKINWSDTFTRYINARMHIKKEHQTTIPMFIFFVLSFLLLRHVRYDDQLCDAKATTLLLSQFTRDILMLLSSLLIRRYGIIFFSRLRKKCSWLLRFCFSHSIFIWFWNNSIQWWLELAFWQDKMKSSKQ